VGVLQQSPKTVISPRVLIGDPKIIKATIDKPLHIASSAGPTTRSKYSQALADIVKRSRPKGSQPTLDMMELAQAIVDDMPTIEFANEVFDEDSGKFMKYRQLITHPKYREVWMHSSANEFG
jgi:hypothetical protein